MEKECVYFQWRNEKCFKYLVEDRPRKKYVYGLANCMEPGAPDGIVKTLILYSRTSFILIKKLSLA